MAEQGQDGEQGGPAFGRMARPQTLPQALVAVMDAQDHLEAAMAAQLGAEGAFYDLQAQTDGREQAAVQRLVGTPNLASGKTPPAPHSATSAASVAATADAELRDHLAAVRSAGRVKAVAEHQASVARNRLRSLRLIAAALMLEPRVTGDVPFLAACGHPLARSLLAVSVAHPDNPANRGRTDAQRAQTAREVAEWEAGVKANPPKRVTNFDSAPGGYRDGLTGLEFGPPIHDGQLSAEQQRGEAQLGVDDSAANDLDAYVFGHEPESAPAYDMGDADLGRLAGDVADDIADDITEANGERPDGGQIRGE
jgi:hypothetical protein